MCCVDEMVREVHARREILSSNTTQPLLPKIPALGTGFLPGAHDLDFWPWPRFPSTGSKTGTLALHQPVPMGTFSVVCNTSTYVCMYV